MERDVEIKAHKMCCEQGILQSITNVPDSGPTVGTVHEHRVTNNCFIHSLALTSSSSQVNSLSLSLFLLVSGNQ
jgi:hypothetical protein